LLAFASLTICSPSFRIRGERREPLAGASSKSAVKAGVSHQIEKGESKMKAANFKLGDYPEADGFVVFFAFQIYVLDMPIRRAVFCGKDRPYCIHFVLVQIVRKCSAIQFNCPMKRPPLTTQNHNSGNKGSIPFARSTSQNILKPFVCNRNIFRRGKPCPSMVKFSPHLWNTKPSSGWKHTSS
jgi:hypothetical protein